MKYKLEKGKKNNIFKVNKIKWKKKENASGRARDLMDGTIFFGQVNFWRAVPFFKKKIDRFRCDHHIASFISLFAMFVWFFYSRFVFRILRFFFEPFCLWPSKKKKQRKLFPLEMEWAFYSGPWPSGRTVGGRGSELIRSSLLSKRNSLNMNPVTTR